MDKTNVLLTKKLSNSQIEYIRNSLRSKFNLIVPEQFDEEEILKYASDVQILLGDNITKAMLDGGNIELIQVPWAGVEALDFELLKNYDIPVCNSQIGRASCRERV